MVALKDTPPPISRGSRASGDVFKRSSLNYYRICLVFFSQSVYMFRAGTSACLFLPSVYIVVCSMKRDHSFVNQHVGQWRRERRLRRSNRELSVRECVFSASNKGIIRWVDCAVKRLMTVMNILVWRTCSRLFLLLLFRNYKNLYLIY